MSDNSARGRIGDWLLDTELLRLTRTRHGLSVETKQPEDAAITTTPFHQLIPVERRYCWRYAFDPEGWRWTVGDPAGIFGLAEVAQRGRARTWRSSAPGS